MNGMSNLDETVNNHEPILMTWLILKVEVIVGRRGGEGMHVEVHLLVVNAFLFFIRRPSNKVSP